MTERQRTDAHLAEVVRHQIVTTRRRIHKEKQHGCTEPGSVVMPHNVVISASTERKLTHLRDELHREFTTLTPEHIDRHIHDVEHRILEQARFDDFVPVLVDRYVRQRHARFLAKKGEGVHHIAVAARDFDDAIAIHASKGYDLVGSGKPRNLLDR
jgi:hypothetical protein